MRSLLIGVLSSIALVSACAAEVDVTEPDPGAQEPEASDRDATQDEVGVATAAFSRSDAHVRMAYRGGTGGSWFDIPCAHDEVAIGLYGRSGALVDQVGLVCAPLQANGSIGPYSTRGSAGGYGGGPFSTLCPSGEVLVGLEGRSGKYVDQIGIQCAPVDDWCSCGGVRNGYYAGGGPGGGAFTDTCPKGYVITSLSGRSGSLADAIQGVCTYLQQ
ncbi:hypothetical protein WME97_10005 [Sorangium sp. So ce367]|uniref:hypothetical protein n=1 Tax=Sorangium sp. So ce367 TaxID=3133305 RepID=UPI003F603859